MYPFLIECISQGKTAFFKNEYLFVGSDTYAYDENTKRPVMCTNSRTEPRPPSDGNATGQE